MNNFIFRRSIALCMCLAMLFLFVSLLSTGCGKGKKTESTYGPGNVWVDDMRKRIHDKVDDPQKVADLLAVVDEVEKMLIDLNRDLEDYYAELHKLSENYKSTRAEFQAAVDDFNAKRYQYGLSTLGFIFEMKRIAGREDWKKVADIDKTLYESWQPDYQL